MPNLLRQIVPAAAILVMSAGLANAQIFLNSGANSADSSSGLAGGHVGYNWQSGSFLYGAEGDLSVLNLKSVLTGGLVAPIPGDAALTVGAIDWYGTVRGRLGVTFGQALLYGTGGLAFGEARLDSTFNMSGITPALHASDTRAGWVLGAGFEYRVHPDLSLNLAYQHVDLGSLSGSATASGGGVSVTTNATMRARMDVATIGFSWRFAPTGVPGSFAGGYAGVQAGGAWGAPTTAVYGSGIIAPSDARLKHDIVLVGRRDDGLGLYSYRYLWSDQRYVGVMAQEVALRYPDAVVRDPLSGVLGVNYERIGMPFMAITEATPAKL